MSALLLIGGIVGLIFAAAMFDRLTKHFDVGIDDLNKTIRGIHENKNSKI